MNLFTIPPNIAFLPALMRVLLTPRLLAKTQLACGNPAPQDWTIFLPTRRALRALEQRCLDAKTSPMLLPKLFALGDSDEAALGFSDLSEDMLAIAPALSGEARLMHMMDLIQSLDAARALAPNYLQTMQLADALLRLLDDSIIQGVSLEKLDTLVPQDYADHWQTTLAVLQILYRRWPKRLKALGRCDASARQRAILELQAKYWARAKGPVLMAGSTASQPVIRRLGQVIAARPDGAVILPGLDVQLTKAQSQDILKRHPTHPQYMMLQFLDALNAMPADVRLWPDTHINTRSRQLMTQITAHITNAAATTAPATKEQAISPPKAGIQGLELIEAATMRAEAGSIACLIREAIEAPKRTVALVTPDSRLARAVSAELMRWGIVVDQSESGTLADTALGQLVGLLAEAIIHRTSFVSLLAMLQSPLVCLGTSRAQHWQSVRALEGAWRQTDAVPDAGDVLSRFGQALGAWQNPKLTGLHARLTRALQPLYDLLKHDTVAMLDCQAALEASLVHLLATDVDTGTARLDSLQESEPVLACSERYAQNASAPLPVCDWLQLLWPWLQAQDRPRWQISQSPHPRVRILGVLEARLLGADIADRVILGGLNEGVWPPDISVGPWLSRPMRARLKFPPLEQRIGQSAHDFVQLLAGSKESICTRARRQGTSPTVAARWITGLRASMSPPAIPAPAIWARLNAARAPVTPARAPAPTPAVKLRPRRLSVTQIARLQTNPYEIYARKILGLIEWPAPDVTMDVARRGQFIHKVMEQFQRRFACPKALPDDIPAALLDIAQRLAAGMAGGQSIMPYWRARLQKLAHWLAWYEPARRAAGLRQTFTEYKGVWRFAVGQGEFELSARADRIDVFADGGVDIIDYKTGTIPTLGNMKSGAKPQLPLEGLILHEGGFADIASPGFARLRLTHLNIAGDDKAYIEQSVIAQDVNMPAQAERLYALLAAYEDESHAYVAGQASNFSFGAQPNPYDQLARYQEWQTGENDVGDMT